MKKKLRNETSKVAEIRQIEVLMRNFYLLFLKMSKTKDKTYKIVGKKAAKKS